LTGDAPSNGKATDLLRNTQYYFNGLDSRFIEENLQETPSIQSLDRGLVILEAKRRIRVSRSPIPAIAATWATLSSFPPLQSTNAI
jgi:hypothetical protein